MEYQDLAALVPVVDGIVWSQTNGSTPEFFYYIPEALTKDIPLELVVQDSEDNYVFRRQFSVDADAGILTVPLTSEGAGLIPGEAYSWTFSIYCDAARPSASVSVFGTIQRVANSEVVEPEGSLTSAMELELAKHYVDAGLWHEAMGLTLNLYADNPNDDDALNLLADLLEQAGLSEISLPCSVHSLSQL